LWFVCVDTRALRNALCCAPAVVVALGCLSLRHVAWVCGAGRHGLGGHGGAARARPIVPTCASVVCLWMRRAASKGCGTLLLRFLLVCRARRAGALTRVEPLAD